MVEDLHTLPPVRAGWSFLYREHCRVEQEGEAVAFYDAEGKTSAPAASLALLLLGPGTTVTHAAVHNLARAGCLVLWTGEAGVRAYAQGEGETRRADNFYHHVRMWARPRNRLRVARRLYAMRFPEPPPPNAKLHALRGMEGARVRDLYLRAAKRFGVRWEGRNYKPDDFGAADPVNRALSAANACLYGICRAAIVSAGFAPPLGFIHSGTMSSFVYDIADLYKGDTAIPAAFRAAAESERECERRVRHILRDYFHRTRLLARIIPDIQYALFLRPDRRTPSRDFDGPHFVPADLWDPDGVVPAGKNYADEVYQNGCNGLGESSADPPRPADEVDVGG